MSKIETALARLESGLRILIEGDPNEDGVARQMYMRLVKEINLAMRSGSVMADSQQSPGIAEIIAPDQYTLVLPEDIARGLLAHPTTLDGLTRHLKSSIEQNGFKLKHPPIIRVVANPGVKSIRVISGISHGGPVDTSTLELENAVEKPDFPQNESVPNAFLIVNGLDTLALNQPVINIGRDPSNMLVLNDPRISRRHAQIRLAHSRYTIFDLASTGGTYVNGVRAASHILYAGDVISLAGVPLVYGEERIIQLNYTQEIAADPPAPEVL